MRLRLWNILILSAGFLPLSSLKAQLVPEFKAPRPECCLLLSARDLAEQLQDWNMLGKYHEDNLRLRSQPAEKGRVVFLGDSILGGWKLVQHFPGKPYVNRGIGGQTTQQLLVRFYPDVVNLRPAAVVILAGINDIARVTGPVTLEMVGDNFRAMCDLARQHNIKVVLCPLIPTNDYTSRKWTDRPRSDILKLNDWLRSYAAEIHVEVADFHSVLVDSQGQLKEGYSNDGVHPNERGFALMVPVAKAAIDRALESRN